MMINFPDTTKIGGKNDGVAGDESAGSSKGRWVIPAGRVAIDGQSTGYSSHCRSVRSLQQPLMVSPPATVATADQYAVYNSH